MIWAEEKFKIKWINKKCINTVKTIQKWQYKTVQSDFKVTSVALGCGPVSDSSSSVSINHPPVVFLLQCRLCPAGGGSSSHHTSQRGADTRRLPFYSSQGQVSSSSNRNMECQNNAQGYILFAANLITIRIKYHDLYCWPLFPSTLWLQKYWTHLLIYPFLLQINQCILHWCAFFF